MKNLTIMELAKRLSVPYHQAHALVKSKKVKAVQRPNRRFEVDAQSVSDYVMKTLGLPDAPVKVAVLGNPTGSKDGLDTLQGLLKPIGGFKSVNNLFDLGRVTHQPKVLIVNDDDVTETKNVINVLISVIDAWPETQLVHVDGNTSPAQLAIKVVKAVGLDTWDDAEW